ncbi:MAG: glycosyltransferase family 2 protein [Deltaproteobacteria bacterium]|nr:glycosyltransferase family 2 protein [Deltaproteobacteria bacterium]
MISVIIPVYKEAENIAPISSEVSRVLSSAGFKHEIILVDDNSKDGTKKICASLVKTLPLKLIIRKKNKGLAPSVIKGIENAAYDIIIVMDADFSHPPSALPKIINALLKDKADFVIGSRYIKGGAIDKNWGFFRRINSKAATLLAKPLTKVKDPMSGFFCFYKKNMPDKKILSPVGYKICLEIITKGNFLNIKEIPIHFTDRSQGKSKFGLKEQFNFILHLIKLYLFLYPNIKQFMLFSAVGASGFVIDLSVYIGLQKLFNVNHILARGLSFWAAASSNWALNRKITFKTKTKSSKLKQWASFLIASLLGFSANFGIYYLLTGYVPFFKKHLIAAFIIGISFGLFINFILSASFVFKKKMMREKLRN